MIEKSLGVRPKGKSLFISRHRGFTLVEVLMSVVLLALGAALALPSYRDMIEKRQVTNGAEQLASFINSAQGAAMKTNKEVWVSWSRTADNSWCVGANLESSCDCTQANACTVSGQPYVIDNSAAGNRNLVYQIDGGGIDNAYAFDPIRGLMLDLEDSLELQFRSPNGDFRMNLQVSNTGRVTLCSKDESHAVPGYEVCEPDGLVEFVEAEI